MTQADSMEMQGPRSWSYTAALAAYVVSRFVLYVCFSASASDVEVYFRYAVAAVDYGKIPYRDIQQLEYPPTAYWVFRAPRLFNLEPNDKLTYPPQNKAEADLYYKHLIRYDILFRGVMLLFDI